NHSKALPMHLGQSAWGGKLRFPQLAHFVVTNLPSLTASQNSRVREMGMSNLRDRVLRECRTGSSVIAQLLDRTVT
ncbi:MAG TPA: hypothetical protein VKF39_02815, partial [Nitrososphaerales archaeon]|nr:hypothetical protein [Nitrososphaerales archaeon]